MIVHRVKTVCRLLQIQRISRYSSKSAARHCDVFGIADVTTQDVKGTIETSQVDRKQFDKKYAYLNNLSKLDNIETILHNPVGHVRFDKDNQPKYHGQFDEDNEKIRFDVKTLENLSTNELIDQSKANDPARVNGPSRRFNKNVNLASLVAPDKADPNEPDAQRPPKRPRTKPFRPKQDISKVDIYDFQPIKELYSKHEARPKTNRRQFTPTEFRFTNQWTAWIERDSLLYLSPLAKLVRERRMLRDPWAAAQYEELLNAEKAAGQHLDEVPSEDAGKGADEELSYSPLKSFESVKEELKSIEEEESQLRFGAVKEDEASEESEGMNLKPIFEEDILKKLEEQRLAKQREEQETDDEAEQPPAQKPISEMTALEYLRKIKNKEIEPRSNETLKKLISQKKETEKDSVTLKVKRPEFDSKGFKNYKHQTLNLYVLSDADRALFLEGEIIFNNMGIVAVNKPYGVTCPGDKDKYVHDKGKKPVLLDSFLKEFAQLVAIQDRDRDAENTFDDIHNPVLYPIYKLDRNCTGVYILAKNKETTKKVHNLFMERKVSLFYDAITKNVPTAEMASIDIPIDLDRRDPYERMRLRPEVPKKYQTIIPPSKTADKAVTNYKLLKAHKSAAYLELNPLTAIRHQIRAHLGYGLRTPILGDHLYDQPNYVDYQRLPLDMLLNLNIRPTKTMHLPLHLHCKLIILNEFGRNGRDVFLKADLPHFFLENLKSLKLA